MTDEEYARYSPWQQQGPYNPYADPRGYGPYQQALGYSPLSEADVQRIADAVVSRLRSLPDRVLP